MKNFELGQTTDGALTPRERALLTAMAQHPEGLTKPQICTHAGYSMSGKISKDFARFVGMGWMSAIGEGKFMISDGGLLKLGDFEPLSTGADLQAMVIHKAEPAQAAILSALFANYPTPLTKPKICELAKYAPSGKISKVFGKLSRLEWMVKVDDGFRASDDFFK